MLNIAHRCQSSYVWGPGIKYVVWLQGCSRHCYRCLSPEWQSLDVNNWIDIDDLYLDISSQEKLEGIVLSGGEPLLQYEGLAVLLNRLKLNYDFGVICYTGYCWSEIKDVQKYSGLFKNIDLMIVGPYIDQLNSNRGMRGSDNQEFIFLTDRYLNSQDYYLTCSRNIEIKIGEHDMQFIGIPSKEVTKKIIKIDENYEK